ncbi:hypothetical protein GQ43DRAFT_95969 [Delitschia confertaspora ATCC 74209]|uniref:Uncharacterized protein n=1 Tax=Delitschia confertaspora ATCC 74209 TaxID=1513339 RepID=A0A9P4JTS2_9PLEO|nr:hypothetical protein GQ43DRAFT_95969 [Delitschia confertaspora ATCC 74209]
MYRAVLRRLRSLRSFHYMIIAALLIVLLCHCLLLSGNNPTHLPLSHIYILSLYYTAPLKQHADAPVGLNKLEVRAGYYGICVRTAEFPSQCSSAYGRLPLNIRSLPDPYHIIPIASNFKNEVLFPVIICFNSPVHYRTFHFSGLD